MSSFSAQFNAIYVLRRTLNEQLLLNIFAVPQKIYCILFVIGLAIEMMEGSQNKITSGRIRVYADLVP